MIYNIIEVIEPVLYNNEKDTPTYVEITKEFDDVKKVMGEVS